MARPEYDIDIVTTGSNWHTQVNSNWAILEDAPTPIQTYADVPNLPVAGLHENCLAHVHGGASPGLYVSDGSTWARVSS